MKRNSVTSLFRCAILIMVVTLAACSSAPKNPEASTAAKAAQHALSMKGVPYRYGGHTPDGFDCSGLVHYSYSRVGLQLPRSTDGLHKSSRAVSARQLRAGDLLFFNQEGKRSSHVGIYVGNDEFVHAPSTGKNVSVGRLSDPYWRRHFADARRVLID